MVNRTVLQGRLVEDPELRYTPSGNIPVTSFRIAWSEKYKETETKCFLKCTAWRAKGEFINKYFCKGQEIVVEGKLSTRQWEDKDTGKTRSQIELTVDDAHFCGPKQDGGMTGQELRDRADSKPDVNIDSSQFDDVEDSDILPF